MANLVRQVLCHSLLNADDEFFIMGRFPGDDLVGLVKMYGKIMALDQVDDTGKVPVIA